MLRSNEYGIFTAPGIQFAEMIKRETPPQAVVIHAPVHNHPVFLTGRRSLMGYRATFGHTDSSLAQRESEIRRVYAGHRTPLPYCGNMAWTMQWSARLNAIS